MVLILGLERDLPTIILCATCKHGQNPVGQMWEQARVQGEVQPKFCMSTMDYWNLVGLTMSMPP